MRQAHVFYEPCHALVPRESGLMVFLQTPHSTEEEEVSVLSRAST